MYKIVGNSKTIWSAIR